MGYKDVKGESTEFQTSATVQEIGRLLQQICADLKASAEHIQSGSGALASFDHNSDIEVVVIGKVGFLSKQQWAVQIYVTDLGDRRHIHLIALGHGGFAKAMHGSYGALKMSASIEKRNYIANVLGV